MVREKANDHVQKGVGSRAGEKEGMNLGAFESGGPVFLGGVTVRKLPGGCPSQLSDVFF